MRKQHTSARTFGCDLDKTETCYDFIFDETAIPLHAKIWVTSYDMCSRTNLN